MRKQTILPMIESLSYISAHHSSVARFGDGEVDIMSGKSIPYQNYDESLASQLKHILAVPSSEQFLVCLPDVFENVERYTSSARAFWKSHFLQYADFYDHFATSDWYGSTFLSRPYMDLVDKSNAKTYFSDLKTLWEERDVLLVEGETSRSGVGNTLFDNAKSIKRIICPSKNAYAYYQEIFQTVKHLAKDKLVLLMLGPTAKVLAYDLSQLGHQAIDLGHIDSEYEWFLQQATHKIKLPNKHTAEFNYDQNINFTEDSNYDEQIVTRIGHQTMTNQKEKISIIMPVYNVKPYLKRALDSILKQTYRHFELLLINDGSTDGSAEICQKYAFSDTRIRLFHQDNQGVSAARNLGISQVKGKYITFIDSDDFIDEAYLEKLYGALIRNQSDIAVSNFTSFNEERQSFLFFLTPDDRFERNYSRQEWLKQENTARYNLYMVFTFSPLKLFKKSLFDGLSFPLGRLREDDATIYKAYLKANRVTLINEGLYYYSQRSEGLSRTDMLDDIATMISNAEERLALLASLGHDLKPHVTSYLARLKKCQADSLAAGQIELYRQISTKLDLILNYKENGDDK